MATKGIIMAALTPALEWAPETRRGRYTQWSMRIARPTEKAMAGINDISTPQENEKGPKLPWRMPMRENITANSRAM